MRKTPDRYSFVTNNGAFCVQSNGGSTSNYGIYAYSSLHITLRNHRKIIVAILKKQEQEIGATDIQAFEETFNAIGLNEVKQKVGQDETSVQSYPLSYQGSGGRAVQG